MTKDQMMPEYEAGERNCPLCSRPLPAHQLLREQGNSSVRLAVAIAEEAGLRIGEICR
jgi:DNA repair exonuclease SbcCD ATPase subunit